MQHPIRKKKKVVYFLYMFSLFCMLLFSCSIKLSHLGFYLMLILTLITLSQDWGPAELPECLSIQTIEFATFFNVGYLYSTFFSQWRSFHRV